LIPDDRATPTERGDEQGVNDGLRKGKGEGPPGGRGRYG